MTYTIMTKKQGVYKYILFVHPLCRSVRFGFKLHPGTGYCRGFANFLEYPKPHQLFAVQKRNLGEMIKTLKSLYEKAYDIASVTRDTFVPEGN